MSEILDPFAFASRTAPITPDIATKPADINKTIDQSDMLFFADWHDIGGAYTRSTKLTVWKGDTATINFKRRDLGTVNHSINLENDTYTLLIDGIAHTTTDVGAGLTEATFNIDTTVLSDGWHVLDIVEHGTENSVPYPVFVFRGAVLPDQVWMPVISTSYDIDDKYHLVWVPAQYHPWPAWDAPLREYPHWDTVPELNSMFLEMLTGASTSHPRRMNVNKDGIKSTHSIQDYFWGPDNGLTAPMHLGEILDGPRGVNSRSMVTHITIGTGQQEDIPGSPRLDTLYCTDPWSFFRVTARGGIKTLLGWKDASIPPYWQDVQSDEPFYPRTLVGDWSAVIAAGQPVGLWETWGQCWYPFTLEVDNTAEPIPAEGNRKPHLRNPKYFIADSRHDRIIQGEANKDSHDVPHKASVFLHIPGSDIWDVVNWGNKLICSIRREHRIAQYNMATGEFERDILKIDPLTGDGALFGEEYGDSLAWVDSARFVQVKNGDSTSRAERQALDVLQPEGLYVLGDWLYYGSVAMEQIRRVHLVSGSIEVIGFIPRGFNVNFHKIAVSDGTTGPYGTVFVSTWETGNPKVFVPNGDGTYSTGDWSIIPGGGSVLHRGKGGGQSSTYGFAGGSYNAAIACGNGRIIVSNATESLRQISRALPTDPDIDRSRYETGYNKYKSAGHEFRYGKMGENPHGFQSLPWGEDEDIDYFLTTLGHTDSSITEIPVMANGVFNIAKGRVNEYTGRVAGNDPAASALVVVLLQVAEADATLQDYDTLAALLAGSNTEATFTNYARKVLTDADVTAPTPNDTDNTQSSDIPDQTWTSAGGATNNTLVKLLVCYDADTAGGTDANIIPLTFHDFSATTTGSDLVAQIATAGYFTAS